MHTLILIPFMIGCALIFGTQGTFAQTADRVVTISPTGESYIDPEILPGGHLLTYQSQGGIYIAQLDPETGLFATPTNQHILMDTGATRPLETFNGPEFGIDANGWGVYYAKPHEGRAQIWRAELGLTGTPQVTPLSSGRRHQTQLVSRNPAAETTRIAAIQGTWQNGNAVWFDESTPDNVYQITPIEDGIASLRWIDNSYMLTYSERTGADRGQIVLLDTDTNSARVITADAGDKTDPYGWFAPEFDNNLLVLAILDNSAVAVYRDTGGDAWERITTFYPPAESRFDFVSSAEPFVVGGRSYMSLIVKDADDSRERFSDSEVWLFGLDAGSDGGYVERCDSGENALSRSDPEVYIGDENVFVYYNVIGGTGVTPYEVRRCRSSLTTDGIPTIMPPVQEQPPSIETDEVCTWIAPQDTDPNIDTALDPHYVCYDATATSNDGLMVFLPGTGATPADYELFTEEAASIGLHAINLSYVNPRSVNLQICPRDPDPDCHENARREVIYGGDLHPGVTITDANTITNRLVQLLRYMDASQPGAGWEQYLDGDAPLWNRITIAGHSQGAGMAAFIMHEQLVERAILFAWVDQSGGRIAPWLATPPVTPPERIYYFEHVIDGLRGEAAKDVMFGVFGIDALGETDVDTSTPPYGNAHVLTTAITPAQEGLRESAGPHNAVIGDDFTPLDADGVPILRDVWRYMLGG